MSEMHPDEGYWKRLFGDDLELFNELERFFKERRDHELGRWRFNDHLVVYSTDIHQPYNGARTVHVLDERTGQYYARHEGSMPWRTKNEEANSAAEAFFAAHPVSKPWHDAKPGEVWAVKTKHNDQERPVFVNSDGDFENAEEYFHPEFRDITAGRRLWPEEL